MYILAVLILFNTIHNASASIKLQRTNLEEVMRQRLHEAIESSLNDNFQRRNEECGDDYYEYDDYYGYYNYKNFYYSGFIPEGIVSEQCAATTAVAFRSTKIYKEKTIEEVEEAIEISFDNVTATFCLNGSCDTFQEDCMKLGGHFVTANFTTYSPCNECEVRFLDVNYPLCLGWDCDETEVQNFANYIGKIQVCDDGEDVPVERYGEPEIDSYPNDTNAACYGDMYNLFFNTEVYGETNEFDYVNMNETLCEDSDGVILTTAIADTNTTQQNDQCVNLIDVPLCYSSSCNLDEAENMVEYFFNDVSIMKEEEGCQSIAVAISTIAPTLSSSPSVSPSSVPTISMSPSISTLPTESPTISDKPTDSSKPSSSPSVSLAPSVAPSLLASSVPSALPTQTPSTSKTPSVIPSQRPSKSLFPSLSPSSFPSLLPTNAPTAAAASPTSSPTFAPTNAPTASPTASPTFPPVKTLKDSPFPFRFGQEYYTCTDIGTNGVTVTCDSRNDIAGDVKTHCPATCSAPDVYESNMYVDFGIEKNGGVIKPKQCRPWLSEDDWVMCEEKCAGGADGNFVGILDTCENSCSTCALIGMDSPLPFRFRKKYYTCADVSDAGPVTCNSQGDIVGDVAKHCSATCNQVVGSFDESNMYVDVGIKKMGVTRPKKCRQWLKQNNWSKCVKRCNKLDVRQTCPKTCWECDGRQAV
ncbi:hypothetical protein CTEN210_11930 [Chaetoceros tenuissimus]|uniref:Uncharacterized protein n=1 Tax=Chaetoceros tenuissimus TaxID=426638 RepID=A0AAD3D3L3_9STRA|nr:hypothetical protein CTEN210_11930 [Chaetoceros tenuissimus]